MGPLARARARSQRRQQQNCSSLSQPEMSFNQGTLKETASPANHQSRRQSDPNPINRSSLQPRRRLGRLPQRRREDREQDRGRRSLRREAAPPEPGRGQPAGVQAGEWRDEIGQEKGARAMVVAFFFATKGTN